MIEKFKIVSTGNVSKTCNKFCQTVLSPNSLTCQTVKCHFHGTKLDRFKTIDELQHNMSAYNLTSLRMSRLSVVISSLVSPMTLTCPWHKNSSKCEAKMWGGGRVLKKSRHSRKCICIIHTHPPTHPHTLCVENKTKKTRSNKR